MGGELAGRGRGFGGECAERDHAGEQAEPVFVTTLQVFGDIGKVAFLAFGVAQLEDCAFGHSATVDELDDGAGAQHLDGGMVTVSGGEAAESGVISSRACDMSLMDLAVDIYAAGQKS